MQRRNYFETYKISSVEKAINLFAIYEKYPNLNDSYIFRGQKDINYSLLPSSIRMNNKDYLWMLSGGNLLYKAKGWKVIGIGIVKFGLY